jgi:predicted cupin superfamily sugar epimerase
MSESMQWQTYHVHHAGRSLYTLIKPSTSPDELPTVKRIVMGTNIAAGEVLQLFVEGGWWKASEIPPEDIECVKKGEADPEKVGCLITEVVVPGWTLEQHGFLTLQTVRVTKFGHRDGSQLTPSGIIA